MFVISRGIPESTINKHHFEFMYNCCCDPIALTTRLSRAVTATFSLDKTLLIINNVGAKIPNNLIKFKKFLFFDLIQYNNGRPTRNNPIIYVPRESI